MYIISIKSQLNNLIISLCLLFLLIAHLFNHMRFFFWYFILRKKKRTLFFKIILLMYLNNIVRCCYCIGV